MNRLSAWSTLISPFLTLLIKLILSSSLMVISQAITSDDGRLPDFLLVLFPNNPRFSLGLLSDFSSSFGKPSYIEQKTSSIILLSLLAPILTFIIIFIDTSVFNYWKIHHSNSYKPTSRTWVVHFPYPQQWGYWWCNFPLFCLCKQSVNLCSFLYMIKRKLEAWRYEILFSLLKNNTIFTNKRMFLPLKNKNESLRAM